MIDHVKKTILAGIGAAAITAEKAESALSDLVQKGKISASDAKEAATKMADEGKQEFEEASSKLQSLIDDTLTKMGRGQKERLDAMEARIAELEKKLESCCGDSDSCCKDAPKAEEPAASE